MTVTSDIIDHEVQPKQRKVSRYMQIHTQTASTIPAASLSNEGGIYYDTDDNIIKYSDGTAWRSITVGGFEVQVPGSSTDNAIARFNGTGGVTIQNSSSIIEDDGTVTHTATKSSGGAISSFTGLTLNVLNTENNSITNVYGINIKFDDTVTSEQIDTYSAIKITKPPTSSSNDDYLFNISGYDVLSPGSNSLKFYNHNNTTKYLIYSNTQDTGLSVDSTSITLATTTSGDIYLNPVGQTRIGSSLRVKRTASGAGNYTVLSTDYIIAKTAITGGGDTVTLPEAPNAGTIYIVKDESGTAATNNITIDTTGAPLIDGASSAIISTNYGKLVMYFNGTNYFTI